MANQRDYPFVPSQSVDEKFELPEFVKRRVPPSRFNELEAASEQQWHCKRAREDAALLSGCSKVQHPHPWVPGTRQWQVDSELKSLRSKGPTK